MVRMKQIGRELSRIETYDKTRLEDPEKLIKLGDFSSVLMQVGGRIFGARLGGKWAQESAGGSLQTAQILSQKMKRIMTWFSRDKALQMIHDAILSKDPKTLKTLLMPLGKPGAKWSKNMELFAERINTWLAGTGKRVLEDIEGEQ
jgi:hypothetical protein